jgi:F-type H+-transporting ATPase subunit gamma
VQTLEGLRRRIDTVEELRSVVRTMKALSAASIRQYEEAVVSVGQYQQTIELALRVVLHGRQTARVPVRDEASPAAVVFGSDHGLCGRFNEEVVRHFVDAQRSMGHANPDWIVCAVGARAADRLETAGVHMQGRFDLPSSVEGLITTAEAILLTVDEWQRAGRAGRVLMFHNRRTERGSVLPETTQLLPMNTDHLATIGRDWWPSRTRPMFSMDAERLLAAIIRQHLFVSVYRAGAESIASEHASRLASMQAAERNIDEHLDVLSRELRRLRQESITEELMDVVAGFETIRTGAGDEW